MGHVLLKRHERAGVKWPGLWRRRHILRTGESVNGKNMTTEAK
jgi:hypothetical protein